VSNKIRVLICDDHPLFCEGVKAILRPEKTIEVVGEAHDGRQAVECVRKLKPHVILMDVGMPNLSGFEATRLVLDAGEPVKVLVLTMHDEEEVVARCLEAGAAGYIMKDAPATELVEAIHAVHQGERYLSPQVLSKVVAGYVKNTQAPKSGFDRLSARDWRRDCQSKKLQSGSIGASKQWMCTSTTSCERSTCTTVPNW
jgi:two-component system response regulator DegU